MKYGYAKQSLLRKTDCYDLQLLTRKAASFVFGFFIGLVKTLDSLSLCNIYIYIHTSGGPLSALTCCVNVRLLSAIKKISPLIYSQSWVGSWVYTTQAMMTFTLIF